MISQRNAIPTELTIIGAGGHCKVVIDTLSQLNYNDFIVCDMNPNKVGNKILTKEVIFLDKKINTPGFHIAIGNNKIRENIYNKFITNFIYRNILSPFSHISAFSNLSSGIFVAANSTIAAESIIGKGAIINHGAVVEHDCIVGDFSHIAPNATLLGEVKLGKRVFIGANATILPGIRIADDSIIGAGAVVTKDILKPSCTAIGIPAKIL
ncbi:acetyltransferase [Xenorhabdus bovienii]|uniref:acetyltransferase n=1 Tax=Xenorhabdus bovienii TaxID=40576 RepID=UPI001EDE042E|nr:acetyltransferase [Xenorhabdus bovienii]MCG3470214.1 acetyltransferase [Xenorhabdus bovienii]